MASLLPLVCYIVAGRLRRHISHTCNLEAVTSTAAPVATAAAPSAAELSTSAIEVQSEVQPTGIASATAADAEAGVIDFAPC